MLLRSLWNLQRVPTGMATEHVVTAAISLGGYRYPRAEEQVAFFTELEGRLKRLPGVTSLALSDSLPPAGAMRSTIYAAIEVTGRPPIAEGTGGMVGWRAVTPDYFPALAIPIVEGRGLRQEDRAPAENPIILNETLARKLFPNESSIGRQLRLFKNNGPWRTVVGVAADVKNNGLTAGADPEFFLPWKNQPVQTLHAANVILRTPMRPEAVSAWIRSETAGLDPTLPVKIETMTQRVGNLAQRPRFNALLLALLGASPQEILKMVLGNVARWAMGGAAGGLIGAWFAMRVLQSLLFQVRAHDPLPLGVAIVVLLAAALFAAWIPARRAMRVDPMVALRYE